MDRDAVGWHVNSFLLSFFALYLTLILWSSVNVATADRDGEGSKHQMLVAKSHYLACETWGME